jgi:pyridinium-3,5-biscarboxylic acid mononucleotide sulfurtransferase
MIHAPLYNRLISILQQYQSLAVAFSGGVDSSFLLAAAQQALPADKLWAITVKTPYIPDWEVEEARQIAQQLGVNHKIIELPIPAAIIDNPPDRCYQCKLIVFNRIKEEAQKLGITALADGSNVDDQNDYRPGRKALEELQVISPILEAGIGKAMIREFSQELGLPTWNKPAYACLLTRFPHHGHVKISDLERTEKAEVFLMDLGFKAVRVRNHDDLARIEVPKNQIESIVETNVADKIYNYFLSIGYKHVSIDLLGYRMGSFNIKTNT